jgi:hypothetical protein
MPGPASRRELVRRIVLNEICDDYENLSVSIADPVGRRVRDCGFTIERSEIAMLLLELVELGWAKAYQLGGQEVVEYDRMPSVEEMDNPNGAWFYVTHAGMKVQSAGYEGWPFDDEGVLRKDWTAPVE